MEQSLVTHVLLPVLLVKRQSQTVLHVTVLPIVVQLRESGTEQLRATHVLLHALLAKRLLQTVLHVTVLPIVVLLLVFGTETRYVLSVPLHVSQVRVLDLAIV